ncbi:MAG: hypothetical protein ACHRXM_06660 [Isosphaerales bacterium]
MTDLWPTDLGTVTTKSPLTILKEQASLLGAKTKNIVKATVKNAGQVFVPIMPFSYDFILNAPALDNYRYRLFAVAYDVDLYPVRFRVDDAIAKEIGIKPGEEFFATGEEQFIEILARILGSQKTRHVIHAILSQSTDLVEIDGGSSD